MMKESLRERLIIAGTDEISRYGIANFSLRRVAAACNTSCAAPYKHFKNKEEFIIEIVRYINRQWELLRDQVQALFSNDRHAQVVELCVAYIRFWIANPNYRSILSASDGILGTDSNIDVVESVSIENLIRKYCEEVGTVSEEEMECLIVAVKAITYGITTMLEHGELQNTPQTFDYVRRIYAKELCLAYAENSHRTAERSELNL